MKKRIQPPSIRKLYSIVFFSLFLSFVLSSCSRGEATGNNLPENLANNSHKTIGDLVLQKGVIVLNDESVKAITENGQQINFNYKTTQTDSIKEGTIIIGTKIENDKIRNILAKVTSVTRNANQITFATTDAKLEEVIYSGNISGVYDPSKQAALEVNGIQANYVAVQGLVSSEAGSKISNLEAKALYNKNAAIDKSAISNTINFKYFSFDKTIPLPAQQVGPVTATADVNVKGGFTPKIKYNISFSLGRLSSYYVDFIMDDISLQAVANIQGKLGYTLSLTDYLNIPIAPIVLGPTGLIISPTIAAGPYVGASATGRTQLKLFALTGKANFLVGIKPELNVDLQTITGPQITKVEGDLSAEIGVEIKGAVGLQFLTAPIANSGLRGRVSAVPSLKLELVPNRSMPFELKSRIQADMFYGFGVPPLRYEGSFPLFNKEIPIYKTNLL